MLSDLKIVSVFARLVLMVTTSFCGMVVCLAVDVDDELLDRARGYKDLGLDEVKKIDFIDGLSHVEIRAIARWRIWGDLDSGGSGILSYSEPQLVGLNWVVDVRFTEGMKLKGRLLIDKVTGTSHGEGWATTMVPPVVFGNTKFNLYRKKGVVNLEVRSVKWEEEPMLMETKVILVKDTRVALKKLEKEQGYKMDGELLEDFVSQRKWNADGANYQWTATVPLKNGAE